MKMSPVPALCLTGLFLFAVGCGNSESEHAHAITPPPPQETRSIPKTKEEKIAAINRAPMSKDQKAAAIAKVNAGP